MRATEFIVEYRTGSIQGDVSDALPAAYVIPKLQNQDAYEMYRFGVALAQAGGKREDVPPYAATSPWGENQIVISYGDVETAKMIDQALNTVGLKSKDKKLISTPKSTEAKSVNTGSPVAKPKRNKYGV